VSEKVVWIADLRKLRQEAKLTVEKAAEMIGIPDQSLSRLENGSLPTLANALKIARFLQWPMEEIWGLEDDASE
jgi:DNA-binding XRE family transcriptional regulator